MTRYSFQSKIFVTGYRLLSFAKNMGRNIGKSIRNLSSKYGQKYALKTALKKAIQKTETTVDLIGNKIANE